MGPFSKRGPSSSETAAMSDRFGMWKDRPFTHMLNGGKNEIITSPKYVSMSAS